MTLNKEIKGGCAFPFGGHDQAMAIRDDWPELAGIIDKGPASISEKEQNQILTGLKVAPSGQSRIQLVSFTTCCKLIGTKGLKEYRHEDSNCDNWHTR